jgi:hypothetical protein
MVVAQFRIDYMQGFMTVREPVLDKRKQRLKKRANVAVRVKGYVLIPKRLVTVCGGGAFQGDYPFKNEIPVSTRLRRIMQRFVLAPRLWTKLQDDRHLRRASGQQAAAHPACRQA